MAKITVEEFSTVTSTLHGRGRQTGACSTG